MNTQRYREARDVLLGLDGAQGAAGDDFAWPRLEGRFNWAVDWFDVIARGNGQTALWIVEEDGSETRLSYGEMADRSDRVAAWLGRLGVRRGDRVLLMLSNQIELWESMLAVMKLGAVIIPATPALGPTDVKDRVERGGAAHVIAKAADTEKFGTARGEYTRICVGDAPNGWVAYYDAYATEAPPAEHPGTAPSDPLLLYFTSGTTSKPKLVEHTQISYPLGHLTTAHWIGLRPGDVHLNISSPGWAKHAWSCFFAPWIAEASIFIYNYTRFDAPRLLEQIHRAEVTTLCAPPTVWRMLIKSDLSSGAGRLREVISAGEPLNPEVIDQIQKSWGLTLRDGYGQTEMTLSVGNLPGMPIKPGSMGRAAPGVPVVLVDPVTGDQAEEGEICIDLNNRPPSLMTGYQDDVERNAEAMAGGYYHTGDVARRDQDGYIFFVGRTDDVFKSSDYKISPFELESVLIEHPAVAEAAVVPAPDDVRLAVAKAYVALAPGCDPSRETALAILRHARESLAPFQRVRRLEFFDLPKTISGKIRRVDLRAREDEAAAAGDDFPGEWRDSEFPELRA